MRDAVPHGVLDERLKDQRRHGDRRRVGRDVSRDGESCAEPDALHAKILLGQRDLARQRDARLAAQRQAVAQKLREPQTHRARLVAIHRHQADDGVQTVEQEMRIDLRAKRAQLGVALRHLRFERAALGARRLLRRLQHVVHGHRQQVAERAKAEQQREQLEPLIERHVEAAPAEQLPPPASETGPERRRHERRARRGRADPQRARLRERHGLAQVPGRQRDRRGDEPHRNAEHERRGPGHAEQHADQQRQHAAGQAPGSQVEAQPQLVAQNRMHQRTIRAPA